MVKRRVCVERFELLRIFHRPILGDIELAVGEELQVQHVIDADVRNDGAKQLRMLCQCRPHEQTSIAASFNGQTRWVGIAVIDQITRAGGEIVEDVLLLRQFALLVPLFAELAAAAEIGDGDDSTLIEPHATS